MYTTLERMDFLVWDGFILKNWPRISRNLAPCSQMVTHPSKIVDMYTFLRDTVKVSSQRREEVLFNIGKEPRDEKLEVEFNTTCSFQVFHGLEKVFDKGRVRLVEDSKKR